MQNFSIVVECEACATQRPATGYRVVDLALDGDDDDDDDGGGDNGEGGDEPFEPAQEGFSDEHVHRYK